MKKIFILTATLFIFIAGTFAQKDVKSLGLEVAYSTKMEQAGLGVRFQYGATDQIRIAPSFNYFFENNDNSAWGLNMDLHYLFPLNDGLTLYPIGGFGFLSTDYGPGSSDGFGINFGAGLEYAFSEQLSFYGEGKYGALFSSPDQETIAVGIAVKF